MQIATNFVEWLDSIGGKAKNTINVKSLSKMFQIGFRTHAATSLCVRIKEMPCVPDEVAHARFVSAVRFQFNRFLWIIYYGKFKLFN